MVLGRLSELFMSRQSLPIVLIPSFDVIILVGFEVNDGDCEGDHGERCRSHIVKPPFFEDVLVFLLQLLSLLTLHKVLAKHLIPRLLLYFLNANQRF